MKSFALGLALLNMTTAASATVYDVTVTNLTKTQTWGRALVMSHAPTAKIFKIGQAASTELTALAEEGDPSQIVEAYSGDADVHEVLVALVGLAPGASQTMQIKTSKDHKYITVAGMLGTTNDTFAARRGIRAPQHLNRRTVYAHAFDAGTEKNTELCAHIPGAPCNNPGVRVTEGAEGMVMPSKGIQGGADLDPDIYGWDKKVLKIEIVKVDG